MSSAEWIMIVFLMVTIAVYAGLITSFSIAWSRINLIESDDKPSTMLSVIIPIRNESVIIRRIIDLLLSQDYPESLFEIIIINDHSTDDPFNKLDRYKEGGRIQLLDLPEGLSGKKHALKHGISQAKGKLIVTTDADCRPDKDWLKTISTYYCNGNVKMLSGPVAIEKTKGLFAKFQSLEFISLIGSGAGAIGSRMPIMCNGANLVYEKDAFVEVGGFEGNDHIPGGDDIFLLQKFKNKYGPNAIGFIKNPAAIVYTDASPNLRTFINQRFRWVSKSPAYRDFSMIFTAFVVLLTNLGLFVSLIWAINSTELLIAFVVTFLLKCLIDLPLLWKASGFFRQRHLLLYYLPFQFVYFIFISFSGIFGNLLTFKWKGR
jgi:cellulose synthase/poly-beta-1,6-N-acetylglucosamine synthase-like glycosyltransferase